MIDRLEKFQAPRSWHDFIYGALLLAIVMFAIFFVPAPEQESVTQAEAPSGVSTRPSLAYPLGCPEEDAKGRKLKGTVSIQGEHHIRCYYGR